VTALGAAAEDVAATGAAADEAPAAVAAAEGGVTADDLVQGLVARGGVFGTRVRDVKGSWVWGTKAGTMGSSEEDGALPPSS
jgi:hypothetical protein